VLCDRLYGGRARITELELIPRDKMGHDSRSREVALDEPLLERQALHAHRLVISHPSTGDSIEFVSPLPDDMERALAALRRWRSI
jgi:23S rRNA pseudouridine1911/1915/1917 synthase